MGLFYCFLKKYSNVTLVKKTFLKKRLQVIVWSPSSIITSNFINYKVLLYTGRIFMSIFIRREMVGFRFGEFFLSKKVGIKVK